MSAANQTGDKLEQSLSGKFLPSLYGFISSLGVGFKAKTRSFRELAKQQDESGAHYSSRGVGQNLSHLAINAAAAAFFSQWRDSTN